jgi:hypothetical protein
VGTAVRTLRVPTCVATQGVGAKKNVAAGLPTRLAASPPSMTATCNLLVVGRGRRYDVG